MRSTIEGHPPFFYCLGMALKATGKKEGNETHGSINYRFLQRFRRHHHRSAYDGARGALVHLRSVLAAEHHRLADWLDEKPYQRRGEQHGRLEGRVEKDRLLANDRGGIRYRCSIDRGRRGHRHRSGNYHAARLVRSGIVDRQRSEEHC